VGNTRARRTNTANRAPNLPMHHRHVLVLPRFSLSSDFHFSILMVDDVVMHSGGSFSTIHHDINYIASEFERVHCCKRAIIPVAAAKDKKKMILF
jgi:hypothetical protein